MHRNRRRTTSLSIRSIISGVKDRAAHNANTMQATLEVLKTAAEAGAAG